MLGQNRVNVIADVNYTDPVQLEFLRAQLAHQYETKCFGTRRIGNSGLHPSPPQQSISSSGVKQVPAFVRPSIKESIKLNAISRTTGYPNHNSNQLQQELNTLNYLSQPQPQQVEQQQRQGNYSHREMSRTLGQKPFLTKAAATLPIQFKSKSQANSQEMNTTALSPFIQNRLEEQIIAAVQTDMQQSNSQQLQQQQQQQSLSQLQNKSYQGSIQNTSRRQYSASAVKSKEYRSSDFDVGPGYEIHELNPTLFKRTQVLEVNQKHSPSTGDVSKIQSKDRSKRDSLVLSISSQVQQLSQLNSSRDANLANQSLISAQDGCEDGEGSPAAAAGGNRQQQNESSKRRLPTNESRKSESIPLTNVRILSEMESNSELILPEPPKIIIKNVQPGQKVRRRLLARNTENYTRSKIEYQSDPAYKLIEEYNKSNQNVNMENIKLHSQQVQHHKPSTAAGTRQSASLQSRPAPYYHNFLSSFKDFRADFMNGLIDYHPSNNVQAGNTKRTKMLNQMSDTKDARKNDESNEGDDNIDEIESSQGVLFARSSDDPIASVDPRLLENFQEEFNYYQKSVNRHECLYLCRNQRVPIPAFSSASATMQNSISGSANGDINASTTLNGFSGMNFNSGSANSMNAQPQQQKQKPSIQAMKKAAMDPREEFKQNKRRLERILSISPNKKKQSRTVPTQRTRSPQDLLAQTQNSMLKNSYMKGTNSLMETLDDCNEENNSANKANHSTGQARSKVKSIIPQGQLFHLQNMTSFVFRDN